MKYDNIAFVSQPDNMKITLFRHQLASIYKMEELEREQIIQGDNFVKESKIGINADIAGYGKTYSMIGLIVRNKMEWDTNIPYVSERIIVESNGLVIKRIFDRYQKISPTLILTSSSIINQWKKEIDNTNLKVVVISTRKDVDNVKVESYDVVLVTVSMYNDLIKCYSKYAWKRFIFDEPGHTKVTSMREIKAGFVWFVTASPNSIKSYHQSCRGSMIQKIIGNNLIESIENQFDGLIIRNDPEFVKLSFDMPKTIYKIYKCYNSVFKTISGIANPIICKMIESGNIEGAISALGGNKTKNIVELVKLKKLEELELIKSKINIHILRENTERISYYKEAEERIRKQIEQLESKFSEMLEENCFICLEKISNHVLEPSCQSIFCGECLLKWLKIHNTCPLCRSKVEFNDLIYIKKDVDIETKQEVPEEKSLLKTEQIISIIKGKKDGKFLVFSDYDGSFYPICKILEENNIKFLLLKGNNKTRSNIINDYKTGDINVIFLNSKYDSAGINLQETTDIILYHEICKTTMNQIIARAERIGRKNELYVHQLTIGF
jgi:hypothetical protein